MNEAAQQYDASLTAYIADAHFNTRASAEAFVASGQRLLRDSRPRATQVFFGWDGETVARFRVIYGNEAARPRAVNITVSPVAGLHRVTLYRAESFGIQRPRHIYPNRPR